MPAKKTITFSYKEFNSTSDLNIIDQELISTAKEAAKKAYAPYSGFRVGAAIRLESGRIISGSNVENAAYPSGICAERTAVSFSISNYPEDNPEAIAIAALIGKDFTSSTVSPCGNCRQVLAEEEIRTGKKIRILLYSRKKIIIIESVSLLLPLQFDKKFIKTCHP